MAEEYYQKALAINKELGRKEGIANQYGNLGLIYKTENKKISVKVIDDRGNGLIVVREV